jgi:hypothetical protein
MWICSGCLSSALTIMLVSCQRIWIVRRGVHVSGASLELTEHVSDIHDEGVRDVGYGVPCVVRFIVDLETTDCVG